MARVKLKSLVGEFLDEINGGRAEFARAYRMAVLSKRNLSWDVTGKVKTMCVSVDGDLTATIPDGSLKVVKVGVKNSETGKIEALSENNSLSFDIDCEQTDEPYEERSNYISSSYNDDYIFDGMIHQNLGQGGYSSQGEYRISEEQGIIVFSPEFCHSSVHIEYISSEDKEGDVCVNEFLSEAITAYIRYKWHISKKGTSQVDKEMYKRLWLAEKSNAKFRIKKPKLQDMNRVSRQSVKYLKS